MVNSIAVIVCDDAGLENFSLHGQGSNYPSLPNLTAMANNGVRFNKFRVVPSCSGMRACMHTGRFSDRNGIGEAIEVTAGDEVPELYYSEITFAEFLKLVGAPHKTALIGKDHVFTGRNNSSEFDGPIKQGFDHWVGQLRNIPANVMEGRGYYDWDKRTRRGEFVSHVYNTTDITNEAIAWIDERNKLGEPYVCYVNYQACHNPMDPARSQPPTNLYDTATWGDPPADQWNNMKATLEALDAEFGRLMTYIDLATTTVLFVSDNGTESTRLAAFETHPTKGPYPSNSGKRTFNEPGVRVPVYVQGAGVTSPGRTNDDSWFITDFYQTMGELLGYDPAAWLSDTAFPRRPKRVLDSISFKHVLDNVAGTPRTSHVQGLFGVNGVNPLTSSGQRSVVYKTGSTEYKLIVFSSLTVQTLRLFYNLTQLDADNEFEVGGTELLGGGSDPSVLNATDRAAYDACQALMADLAASITENDLKFVPTTETFP